MSLSDPKKNLSHRSLCLIPASLNHMELILSKPLALLEEVCLEKNLPFDLLKRKVRKDFKEDWPLYTLLVPCEKKDQILGYLKSHPQKDHLELSDVNILPEYQNQGLGHLLLEKILETTNGPVKVQVQAFNEPARRFYESLGFTFQTIDGEFWGTFQKPLP